ncbi:hypothetical protein ASF04_15695 [Duganella sp. Leaf61]|nr:hypothetical protein ASF04_15695 [Duganella sp. Leaf61]
MAQCRHAVVGDDHQVGFHLPGGQAILQACDGAVHHGQRGGGLWRVRAEVVAGVVHIVEIQGHEAEALIGRAVQPR